MTNLRPPRQFGWKNRADFARFIDYRMAQYAASEEVIEDMSVEHELRVKEARGDIGNEAWKALGDDRRQT